MVQSCGEKRKSGSSGRPDEGVGSKGAVGFRRVDVNDVAYPSAYFNSADAQRVPVAEE